MTKDKKPYKRLSAHGNGNFRRNGNLNAKEAELQGAAMLARRVLHTETVAEIGRLFSLSRPTVRKRIDDAQTDELQQLAKDILTERMIPKALSIIDIQLNNGNYEAAKDVLYGLQVLTKGGTVKMEHSSSSTPTLDAIRRERQKAIEGTVVTVDDSPTQ